MNASTTSLGFGLIGTGFMGRAHAIALRAVASVFPEVRVPRCVVVADTNAARAEEAARQLRFERHTDDWRSLLDDPSIGAINICTPNYLHHEMALAALKAGKHVYCEKPLALNVAQAREMADAAGSAGVAQILGFNYVTNPLIRLAREIVDSGEIGDPIGFAGRYLEDYMASPDVPHSWRCERRYAGAGALADLGSHLVNLLHVVLGRPRRVLGSTWTVISERLEPKSGKWLPVENEDVAAAHLEIESGIPATFEISRVATGYKCGLQFEVFGSRGSLRFDQERMNELRFYRGDDVRGRRGFRTILAGPEHADYARFCPAPGHGLGINDLKIIEVRNFLNAVQTGTPAFPGFDEGLRVQQVMAAIETSAAEKSWVDLDLA